MKKYYFFLIINNYVIDFSNSYLSDFIYLSNYTKKKKEMKRARQKVKQGDYKAGIFLSMCMLKENEYFINKKLLWILNQF